MVWGEKSIYRGLQTLPVRYGTSKDIIHHFWQKWTVRSSWRVDTRVAIRRLRKSVLGDTLTDTQTIIFFCKFSSSRANLTNIQYYMYFIFFDDIIDFRNRWCDFGNQWCHQKNMKKNDSFWRVRVTWLNLWKNMKKK